MKAKLFLDSTVLISAVIAQSEKADSYKLMVLGELDIVDLRISREVISDVDRFVTARNPAMLPLVAKLIVTANIAVTPDPNQETVDACECLTGYRPDARILAAALEVAADVLVTHDKKHLLGNPMIKPPKADILVKSPQDCLHWCFEHWKDSRLSDFID
jgi:predicted nucleic acid-binding protein